MLITGIEEPIRKDRLRHWKRNGKILSGHYLNKLILIAEKFLQEDNDNETVLPLIFFLPYII
jgi:hypothetical protein